MGTASGATANAEWECETRGPTFRALSGNLEHSSPPNIILLANGEPLVKASQIVGSSSGFLRLLPS